MEHLDTPFLAVDLDAFERNVATCFERLAHVDVRPHQKTAKSPEVARRLVRAGARGICVAKLSEAEVFLAAGLDDILITTELAGPVKAHRLAETMNRWPGARLVIVVDAAEAAAQLDAALRVPVDTLIEVNVGQDRCGVAPEDVAALAARLPAKLNLIGVQGYEGHLQLIADPDERRRACDAAMERLAIAALAVDAQVVTTGGTGTAELCAAHDVVTEVQPGSFVFMDAAYGATGVPFAPALTVHATVISRPAADRAVIDAGVKTLSVDLGPARVHDPPGCAYAHAGDEHGIVTGPGLPGVGGRVTLIPAHGDTTVNLHDTLHVHRGGHVTETWAVAARGCVT